MATLSTDCVDLNVIRDVTKAAGYPQDHVGMALDYQLP